MYPAQVTTADEIHELKNGGAHQTCKYLKGINTTKKPFYAVFVVSKGKLKKQPVKGKVPDGKRVVMEEKAATQILENSFQQWLVEI